MLSASCDPLFQYTPSVQMLGILQFWKAEGRASKVVDEQKFHGGIPSCDNFAGLE